jgi:hypothetical protein
MRSIKLNRCYLLIIFLVIQLSSSGQQIFYATIASPPADLSNASGSCATPGAGAPNMFPISVSNVGTLSSSKAVCRINLTFTNCNGSFNLGTNTSPATAGTQFRLMAPDGTTCFGIFSGGLGLYDGTLNFGLVSSTTCLNNPSGGNMPTNPTASGLNITSNSGLFVAGWNAVGLNLATAYNGINANGTWKLIFSESTSSEPCLQSASLVFGDPTVDNQIGNGDNCVNPIIWDGGPFCTATNGLNNSSQMPGWQGPGLNTWGTFNGGLSCAWNFANNNDVWIKFIAQSSQVCVNISGLDESLQSVVVTDSNNDGDNNPCTGAGGGQYWNLVSCPNSSIYTTTAGEDANQNHCFTATVGQTYYLVVDGNGGAESPFYVSGISGTAYNLPIELVAFGAALKDRYVLIDWKTLTERNNDYFIVERSLDGVEWEIIDKIDGAGNSTELLSYKTYDFNPYRGISYYRLKQIDFDGKYSYSEIRSVTNTDELMVLPNPSTGIFGIGGMPKHQENSILVIDITGQVLEQHSTEEESFQLDLTHRTAGIYFVIINGIEPIKIIKN